MGRGCSHTIGVPAPGDDRRRSPPASTERTKPVPPFGGTAHGYADRRASTRRRSLGRAGDCAGAGGAPERPAQRAGDERPLSGSVRRAALRHGVRDAGRAAAEPARGSGRRAGLRRRRPGARLHGHRADRGRPRALQPGGDPQRAAGHAPARRLRRHDDGGRGRGRRHRHPGDHADHRRPRDRRDPGADRRCDPQRARAHARGAGVRAADRRAPRPRRRARRRSRSGCGSRATCTTSPDIT